MTVLHAEMEKELAKIEANLHSVREGLHNRMDGMEGRVAADLANVLSRLQEAEEGIVRHRDQLMQVMRADVLDKLYEFEARIKALETVSTYTSMKP